MATSARRVSDAAAQEPARLRQLGADLGIGLNALDFTTTPAYPDNASIAIMPQGHTPWNVDATKLLKSAPA